MREVLRQGGWWTLNKKICDAVGFEAAILLSILADSEHLHRIKNEIDDDVEMVEFSTTDRKIQDIIGISPYKIGEARKALGKDGLIKYTKKGVPARNFYKIFWNKCQKIVSTSTPNNKALVTKIFGHHLIKELILRIGKAQTTILKKIERKRANENKATDPEHVELLLDWMEHRKRKTISELAAKRFLDNCEEHGTERAREVVDYSIDGSIVGLYWKKRKPQSAKTEKMNDEKFKLRNATAERWKQKNKELGN